MQVKLITVTTGVGDFAGHSLDEIIVAQARVSSGKAGEELFKTPEKLIRYCISRQHWSVFATVNLGFEIITSRAISRQLLRHSAIKPQEFSQRYAEAQNFEPVELRMAATTNRQSSSESYAGSWGEIAETHCQGMVDIYQRLLADGVASETARFYLPESTQSRLYMNGTVRDWITLLNVRLHESAQKECRQVAEAIRDIFMEQCPIIAQALFNFEGADKIHILERVVLERYGVFESVRAKVVGADMVNHPPHYQSISEFGKVALLAMGVPSKLFTLECREALRVLETNFDWRFSALSAVKYLWRCEQKGNLKQDLEKALWYLKDSEGGQLAASAVDLINQKLSELTQ